MIEHQRMTFGQTIVGACILVGATLDKFFGTPEQIPGVVHAEILTAIIIGLVMASVSLILSELLAPKPDLQDAKPSGDGDFKFPTAEEGRVIPLIWGRIKIKGPNVVWWGNLQQQPIKKRIKTGLWSKKTLTTGYRFFVGIQMALCRSGGSTGVTLHKIWIGEKVLQDGGFTHDTASIIVKPGFFGGDNLGTGGIDGGVRLHDGRDLQAANAYLQNFQGGVAATPAYTGTAYVVAEGMYVGNSTTIKPWSFEVSRFPSGLLDQGASAVYEVGHNVVAVNDVNPMEVAYEIFTDNDWGFGFLTPDIDAVAFSLAAETLWDESNGFGMTLDRGIQASALLEIVQRQIDGIFYLDKSTGKITVKLARDDYVLGEDVTSITGTDTFNVASGGDGFAVGDTVYAEEMVDAANDGEWTVTASTATTVVVSGTLANTAAGGSISNIALFNDDNVLEVKDFSRQTWEGTTNQLRISFIDRSRDYFATFAQSHDGANQAMQQGQIIPATISMPGVKDRILATALAARELRFLSFPLAKATLLVDRQFWNANPGDVFRWGDTALGFSNAPFRVTRVDYGDDVDGQITVGLLQDIFSLEESFFGDPEDTGWVPITQDVVPIPTDEHQVFEAPKAIVDRDPEYPARPERVFVGARAQGSEVGLNIYRRNHPTDPSSETYAIDGDVAGMFLMGGLNVQINIGDANPTTTIQVSGSPDSISRIVLALDPEGATALEVGQDLANIIKIGDEFIGFEGFGNQTATEIDLTTCHRGLMDSVPATHLASADVFLLFVNAGLSNAELPIGDVVDIQPRAFSRDDELTTGESKTFQLTMDNRYRRPYPPFELSIATVRFDTTVDIDATITNPGGDAKGLDVDWKRRDWETTDEVESLTDDAATLDAAFQAKNDHESLLLVSAIDADGLTVSMGGGTWINGNSAVVARGDALAPLDGALPGTDELVVQVSTRHTVDAVVHESLVSLDLNTTPSSAELGSLAVMGTVFANGHISKIYTVAAAVTHDLTVGSATTGVEYRKNGGTWTAIASLSGDTFAISDTIELRHADTSETPLNTVAILDQNGTDVAYAVFNTSTEYDAMVAYWNMNEASSIDRVARFGGSPDLTNTSAPSVAGKFGNAAQCRDNASTQEHLSLTNAAYSEFTLDYATSWTISMWVNHAVGTTTTAGAPHFHGFVFHGVWPSDRSFVLGLSTSTGYVAITYNLSGTLDAQVSSGTLADATEGVDHHLAMVYDAAGNTIELFVDGVSEGTAGTSGTLNQPAASELLMIGAVNSTTLGAGSITLSCEDTAIDDMRIYKRDLSSTEVLALFNAAQPL